MAGFQPHQFYVSQCYDGGAYLLYVAALPWPPKRRAATSLPSRNGERLCWLADVAAIEPTLLDCQSGPASWPIHFVASALQTLFCN